MPMQVISAVVALCLFASVVTTTAFGDDKNEQELVPANLQITVEKPKEGPKLKNVNSGEYSMTVRLKNTGKERMVLWPFLSMEVFDDKGEKVDRSQDIGRFGGRLGNKSILEDFHFESLKPGESLKFEIKLNEYWLDPEAITGWQLPAKGKYKVEFRYHYDRAEVKKIYGEDCKTLEKATAPWNQALEVNSKFDETLTVK